MSAIWASSPCATARPASVLHLTGSSTLVPRVSLGGRSGVSIWAQDNHWRIQQQSWTNALGTASAVGSVLTNALTSRSFGLAASPTIRGS